MPSSPMMASPLMKPVDTAAIVRQLQDAARKQARMRGKHEAYGEREGYVHGVHTKLLAMPFTTFNRYIGLPLHPKTLKASNFTPSQRDFLKLVNPSRPTWIHLNKARQCGWSEMVLRIMGYNAFHKYRGKKIGIVAGTNEKTTRQLFGRLVELFDRIPETVLDKRATELHLVNGTSFYAGAANVETFTGWTKFSAFLMDESAKWDLKDDEGVLNATLPIARASGADVFMISTPKGPRGFFYHIAMKKKSEFTRVKCDIWEGGRGLYTRPEIRKMIEESEGDPAQEYLCEFSIGRGSIWGYNTDDDRTGQYREMIWDAVSDAAGVQ